MERIEINGFLTIDHANFEIRKINVLIGEQAQGKSVIAKLVYFFKNSFSDVFYQSIQKFETKRDIEKKCLIQFEQIFPRYSWANKTFSIVYTNGACNASIIRTQIDNKYVIKFNYSENLIDFHKELKNTYKAVLNRFSNRIERESEKKIPSKIDILFYETTSEKIDNSNYSNLFKTSIFIPAGRSFFATLQKNVFSFLANDLDIDILIKEFGSRYEQSKRFHQIDPSNFSDSHKTNDVARKKINHLINEIIVGEYLYSEGQDWILSKGNRTNLAHTSSGQQESLPMLLVLKSLSRIYEKETTFFIEEPEAHLFPVSQKQIISLLATIHNAFGHYFFITTHSPYILTAINNLVIGQDAYVKAKDNIKNLKKLAEVLSSDELIRLEDVSAYTLKNGCLESIIDTENRLIGANLLDSISDEFEIAFNVAADILYGDD